jgi:hypothetical protein
VAIRARRVGDSSPASSGDWSLALCDDSVPLNTWSPVVIYTDPDERHAGPYYPMLSGASPSDWRLSTDGTDAGAGPWGGTIALGGFTSSGVVVWTQKRAWSRATLALPQGGIEDVASLVTDLGYLRSTGKGADELTLASRLELPFADTGRGADTTFVSGAPVELLNLGDTGKGADAAVLVVVYDLGGLVSTGKGKDAATLGVLRDLAMADKGAGKDAVTMETVAGGNYAPAGSYYVPASGTTLTTTAPSGTRGWFSMSGEDGIRTTLGDVGDYVAGWPGSGSSNGVNNGLRGASTVVLEDNLVIPITLLTFTLPNGYTFGPSSTITIYIAVNIDYDNGMELVLGAGTRIVVS